MSGLNSGSTVREKNQVRRRRALVGAGAATVLALVTLASPAAAGTWSERKPITRPEGATGKCNDNTYTFAKVKKGSCWGHGGVKKWYATDKDDSKDADKGKKGDDKSTAPKPAEPAPTPAPAPAPTTAPVAPAQPTVTIQADAAPQAPSQAASTKAAPKKRPAAQVASSSVRKQAAKPAVQAKRNTVVTRLW